MQVMGGVGGHHTAAEGRYLMLGNGFLLLNTLAMALYYLRSAFQRIHWRHELVSETSKSKSGTFSAPQLMHTLPARRLLIR